MCYKHQRYRLDASQSGGKRVWVRLCAAVCGSETKYSDSFAKTSSKKSSLQNGKFALSPSHPIPHKHAQAHAHTHTHTYTHTFNSQYQYWVSFFLECLLIAVLDCIQIVRSGYTEYIRFTIVALFPPYLNSLIQSAAWDYFQYLEHTIIFTRTDIWDLSENPPLFRRFIFSQIAFCLSNSDRSISFYCPILVLVSLFSMRLLLITLLLLIIIILNFGVVFFSWSCTIERYRIP